MPDFDADVLADLRTTVLDSLPDSCSARKKQVGTTNPVTNSDGMGGFAVAATATQDDFIEVTTVFKCRVTLPRSSARSGEFDSNQQFITQEDIILCVGVTSAGVRPDFLPEDEVSVTDGESGITVNYSIKRRLPHSSPLTMHYTCVFITG